MGGSVHYGSAAIRHTSLPPARCCWLARTGRRNCRPISRESLATWPVRPNSCLCRDFPATKSPTLSGPVTGAAARDDWATVVHERSAGHPFFARELCQLLASGGTPTDVPAAVRDVIGRRLARLSPGCDTLLDAAAIAGGTLRPDVLAEVTRLDTNQVAALTEEAVAARVLTSTREPDQGTRFVHDLYRESLYAGVAPARRLELHHRVATALLRRHERGSPVFAAELAYHFTAAIPATDTAAAVLWAQSAARADAVRFAFLEAAGHLTRLRSAVARGGESLPDTALIGLLTDEAELRLRGGDAVQARALLETA
jgi:predicted ATPase